MRYTDQRFVWPPPREAHAHDRTQVEDLYASHRKALFRYLNRYTGDRDEVADVLQETYLRLLQHPPDHEKNVRGWLFTVATNVLRDNARQRHAEVSQSECDEPDQGGEAADDPVAELERAECRRAVRRMLMKLSIRERTILLMRSEGFTHREIAEAVGTTTGSIGTMIFRALKKLSRQLADSPEDYL